MTTQIDRQAAAMARQQSPGCSWWIIEGRYVGRKTASYLKSHTRCTKGHGWTLQGEFGGCAQCEKEG